MSAVSAAENASTSRRMRIARWRAGRCCRLATSASRSDSRATTAAAGSSAGGAIICPATVPATTPRLAQPDSAGDQVRRKDLPGPRAARGSGEAPTPSGRRWWRSCRARTESTLGPRTQRINATPEDRFPGPGPRRRAPSRPCGSSAPRFPAEPLGLGGEPVLILRATRRCDVTPARLVLRHVSGRVHGCGHLFSTPVTGTSGVRRYPGSVQGDFSRQQGQFADGGPGFQFRQCFRAVAQYRRRWARQGRAPRPR